jgi:hypothetical protein
MILLVYSYEHPNKTELGLARFLQATALYGA